VDGGDFGEHSDADQREVSMRELTHEETKQLNYAINCLWDLKSIAGRAPTGLLSSKTESAIRDAIEQIEDDVKRFKEGGDIA
jgi:hypothetical protein